MASKLDEIEKAALSLPEAERAQLVTRLVASLGDECDTEIELAWVEEAGRRYQEAVEDPSAVEPAAADTLHVAVAAAHGIHFLLTWNSTHIANAELRPTIERVCRGRRCSPPILCTPDELLGG